MKSLTIKLIGLAMTVISYTNLFGISNEALSKACKMGDFAAVKKEVESGANVNTLRTDGAPILADAMFWPEITQYLIDNGADPNAGTFPVLMIAAGAYSYETMEVLLKNGADVNKPQIKKSLHPMAMAINIEKAKKKPNKKVVKQLEKMLADQGGTMEETETKTTIIENTINTTNCIKCLELLLKYKANPNEKDVLKNDLLTNAVTRWMDISSNFISYGKMLSGNWGYKLPDWFNGRVKNGS